MSQDHFPSFEGAWARLSQVAVKSAEYDSRERQPHPKCLEGTRVGLLNHIHEILDNREESRLIWLHGTAGVGKSAVAFTVAERMKGLKMTEDTNIEKRLGGSFFLSRKHTDRCTTGYFFATLVYQLASNFLSIQEDVNKSIRDNPALLDPNKSLRDQMEALFLQPLRRLQFRLRGCQPLTFVVDALDECTSEPELVDLILFLARALREPDLPVAHILLTSRTESHICKAFQKAEVRPLVCEIPVKTSGPGEGVTAIISLDGEDVDNDIYVFLQHSFREMGSYHPDFPQPSRDQLARLASRAGRRFIVASTMMMFIDDGDDDPRDRPQLMLELTSELLPGTEVYKLYDSILSTCTNPKRAYMHLSIVAALADPLPMSQISKLLGPGLGRDVETVLMQLRSVMDIPTDGSFPVNIYHASVRDYVSDPSNCNLSQVPDTPSPHSLLAFSSFQLMVKEIPGSTALLDALSELKGQSRAVQPHDPWRLIDSLAFLAQPPEPLSVLIGLLWLRGDRSLASQSWLETQDGCAWLQTQRGKDWLWTPRGENWLQTHGGKDWLKTKEGKDWLQTWVGQRWLSTAGNSWLLTRGGKNWLQTWSGKGWLRTQGGQDWLRTQGGRDWLQTKGGRDWLQAQGAQQTPVAHSWLLGGGELLQTTSRQDLMPAEREYQPQSTGMRARLRALAGQDRLGILDRQDWLNTQHGQDWLKTTSGKDWLNTQRGQDWLETQHGQDWLKTLAGQDWLGTQDGQDWLNTQGRQDWLNTQGGQDWLQTLGGRDWLQVQGGRDWLQTQCGKNWLATPHGRAWQSTPAAFVWVIMEEFSSTLDAISKCTIIPEMSLQPAVQAIQQFKSLPDFLMFPAFLALRYQHHSTSAIPEGRPDGGIVDGVHAFMTFAKEAQERSQSVSDSLKYACQNWATHLSCTPSPWDDKLDHMFQAFWNHRLLSWLEMQWCLKGLPSCIVVLSEAQKLAKVEPVNAQPHKGLSEAGSDSRHLIVEASVPASTHEMSARGLSTSAPTFPTEELLLALYPRPVSNPRSIKPTSCYPPSTPPLAPRLPSIPSPRPNTDAIYVGTSVKRTSDEFRNNNNSPLPSVAPTQSKRLKRGMKRL